MSDSSDKPISTRRRQPIKRRQRQRRIPQPVSKPATELTRLNPRITTTKPYPPMLPPGQGIPRSQVNIPTFKKVSPQKRKGEVPTAKSSNVNLRTVRVQKQGLPKVPRYYSRKTKLKPMARALLYGLRLVILGVGMGAIVGTLLSVFDPANRMNTASLPSNPPHLAESPPQLNSRPPATTANLYLSQEITPLKISVQNLVSTYPTMTPGVFLLDLDSGAYIDINSSVSFPAASTIKIPILLAFFQDVEAGKIHLDEIFTLQQEMIVGGSGNLQYKPPGSKFSAMEIVNKMITISDNTATNMLIAKLGGKEALNQRFRSWGLVTTTIRNPLPDLAGTNTTSPRELGNLLAMINQGGFVSMRSRDLMLDIMRRTQRDNLLPSGLGNEAEIYHKTGDIATLLADAGLIDVPTGKRYVAAVMVKRPNNDPLAEKLISAISQVAYQHFSQVAVTPNIPPNISPNNPSTNTYQQPVQPMVAPFISNDTTNYQSPITTPPP